MAAWKRQPLDGVYPVVSMNVIHVKIRAGQVANRPADTTVGVTVDGSGRARSLGR